MQATRQDSQSPNTECQRGLSLDGGGIYGLTTAILLRQLCDDNPDFLTPNNVDLFAGTSAGAVNAILLAQEDNPRDAVMNGTLEKFWKDQRVYAGYIDKKDPFNFMNAWKEFYSNIGLMSYFAGEPFLEVLGEYFKVKTLGELKHRVMITTYDIYGDERQEPRQWQPKIFYNFPDASPYLDQNLVELAYSAGTLPGLRKCINGLVDGGLYIPNPSTNTITKLIEQQRYNYMVRENTTKAQRNSIANDLPEKIDRMPSIGLENPNPLLRQNIVLNDTPEKLAADLEPLLNKPVSHKVTFEQIFTVLIGKSQLDALGADINTILLFEQLIDNLLGESQINAFTNQAIGKAMKNVSVLSIGVGTKTPAYYLKKFEMSTLQFAMSPVNPLKGNWFNPLTYLMLDAPSEEMTYTSDQLIGERYFRLNPPILGAPESYPLLPATFAARNPIIKDIIVNQVIKATQTSVASEGVRQASRYIKSWWQ